MLLHTMLSKCEKRLYMTWRIALGIPATKALMQQAQAMTSAMSVASQAIGQWLATVKALADVHSTTARIS